MISPQYTVEYRIAKGTSSEITLQVNQLLSEGWELYGPLVVEGIFFQPMIRRSIEEYSKFKRR